MLTAVKSSFAFSGGTSSKRASASLRHDETVQAEEKTDAGNSSDAQDGAEQARYV